MTIKSITVTLLAPMSDHAANRGEKLLGNASSIKRRPDGRVYISGQMQRHALFSAIDRLNADDPDRGQTHVANGDAPTTNVDTDLRSDLGGYLDPNKGDYSGRRDRPAHGHARRRRPAQRGRPRPPDPDQAERGLRGPSRSRRSPPTSTASATLMRMSFHPRRGRREPDQAVHLR